MNEGEAGQTKEISSHSVHTSGSGGSGNLEKIQSETSAKHLVEN